MGVRVYCLLSNWGFSSLKVVVYLVDLTVEIAGDVLLHHYASDGGECVRAAKDERGASRVKPSLLDTLWWAWGI